MESQWKQLAEFVKLVVALEQRDCKLRCLGDRKSVV